MKSRVSCCNAALMRRNLTRSALIWVAYLIIWFVILPAGLLSNTWRNSVEMQEMVLQAAEACHGVSFIYGAAVAWFMFSYLNKSRSANFFGALPLRRETQFLTNYFSGLLCAVVPNFLIMGLTILASAVRGGNVVVEAGIWFAANSMTYLFYYSFAVLCAMAVGQVIAMPLLYGVLNFAVVVVEAVLRSLSRALVYGIRSTSDFWFTWMSPLYYFLVENNGPQYRGVWTDTMVNGVIRSELTDVYFTGWSGLWAVTGVGILFAAIAFLMYRRRRMESAGDVMAVRQLKPVFRWCFILGFTMVVGTILAEMLVTYMDTGHFWSVVACLLVSAVAGSLLSEAILSKSLRVFHRKSLLNCAISLAVVLALTGGCRLDVLGVARYVPEFDQVEGVIFDGSFRAVEDPEIIMRTLALHEDILEQQHETERQSRLDTWCPWEGITYVLKDGREVTREYRLPVNEQTGTDPNSLIRRMEDIQNTPAVILAREVPYEFTEQDIDNCHIYYLKDEESGIHTSIDPKASEAMYLWTNGILPDLKAGNMGKRYHTSEYTGVYEFGTEVSVELALQDLRDANQNEKATARSYFYFPVPITAVNTIRVLQELGVPEWAFRANGTWAK